MNPRNPEVAGANREMNGGGSCRAAGAGCMYAGGVPDHKPYLRRVLMLVACLLCGVVMTVAVAIGCASWSPHTQEFDACRVKRTLDHVGNAPPEGVSVEAWQSNQWAAADEFLRLPDFHGLIDPHPTESFERLYRVVGGELMDELYQPPAYMWSEDVCTSNGFGLIVEAFAAGPLSRPESNLLVATITRSGWPARSCSGATFRFITRTGARPPTWVTAMDMPEFLRSDHSTDGSPILPYGVVWSGFLLNTAFYGAIFWMLLLGRRWSIRAIRRRRNRCPSCNYDRRGLASPAAACPECGEAPRGVPVDIVAG